MMNDFEVVFWFGIEVMCGLVVFYVGEDELILLLLNVSLWIDLDVVK